MHSGLAGWLSHGEYLELQRKRKAAGCAMGSRRGHRTWKEQIPGAPRRRFPSSDWGRVTTSYPVIVLYGVSSSDASGTGHYWREYTGVLVRL